MSDYKSKNKAGNFAVSNAVRKLGNDINLARRHRGWSKELFAQKIGCTRPTLDKMEAGDPGVTMKTWARALFCLGKLDELSNIIDFSNDLTGQAIANAKLTSQRTRQLKIR